MHCRGKCLPSSPYHFPYPATPPPCPSHMYHTQVREDEASELTTMLREYCHVTVQGGVENTYGKVNILLQSFVSRGLVDTFSLVSDMNYVSQASPPLPSPLLFPISLMFSSLLLPSLPLHSLPLPSHSAHSLPLSSLPLPSL